jgi:outer membrane protein TolC
MSDHPRPLCWLPWLLLATLPLAAETPAGDGLTLRGAATRAAERGPDLGASRAAAAEAEASSRLAEDTFKPEAFALTTPGVSRGLPVDVIGAVPAIFGLEVHQIFYDPQHRSEAIAARAEAVSSASAYERARLNAARAAAEAYARCWSDDAVVAAANRRRAARERTHERVAALLREGRATEVDLGEADLNVARAKLRNLDAESERSLDLAALRRLTGLPTGTEVRLAEAPLGALPAPGSGDALTAAIASDPEIRSANESINLLERAQRLLGGIPEPVVAAEAQYYRLTRANGIDQFYRNFRDNDWSIALSVTYPLWSAGRAHDALAKAQAKLSQTTAHRDARRSTLALEVQRAEAALTRAAAAAQVAEQARVLAELTLRQAQALAGAARGEPGADEVREAELADAEADAAAAEFRLVQARLELLALRGELGNALLGGAGGSSPSGPVTR